MALIKRISVAQSAVFNNYSLNIGSQVASSNFLASGSFSFSSVLYTVPSGKIAKVIINNIQYSIVNSMIGSATTINPGTGAFAGLAVFSSTSFAMQNSYNLNASFNFFNLFTNSISSLRSGSSAGMTSFRTPVTNVSFQLDNILVNGLYGLTHDVISFNATPIDNSNISAFYISYLNPLSAYWRMIGLILDTNATSSAALIDGVNTSYSNSTTLTRTITAFPGESFNVNLSFSFIFSVSHGLTPGGLTSLRAGQSVNLNFDFIVIEDSI